MKTKRRLQFYSSLGELRVFKSANPLGNLKCKVQDNHVITTDVTLSSLACLAHPIVSKGLSKGVLLQSSVGTNITENT